MNTMLPYFTGPPVNNGKGALVTPEARPLRLIRHINKRIDDPFTRARVDPLRRARWRSWRRSSECSGSATRGPRQAGGGAGGQAAGVHHQ
eukprot:354119-Prorocentrum_minimum.AAC.1